MSVEYLGLYLACRYAGFDIGYFLLDSGYLLLGVLYFALGAFQHLVAFALLGIAQLAHCLLIGRGFGCALLFVGCCRCLCAFLTGGRLRLLKFVERRQLLLFKEFIDSSKALLDLAVAELIYFFDKPVEKLSVVAHNDYRAVELLYGLLEDILCAHVEVVGGLVENEQVDRLQEQAYHCESGFFTA